MQHAQNVGPNFFALNKNSVYVMPHDTAWPVTSCTQCGVHACRKAGHPYVNVVCQKLLMHMLFVSADLYLSKFTTSHFGTINPKIANQNTLKRIVIAMHNENKTDCNENFRIYAEEPI